ncbi:ester cyclase [Amycolatopsis sp. NPDC049253]|jgi:predicted ester cyclase|uniref:ester cyclase n=1 Tax=Amycolatopsis sp. NPDC049253 TaxID=3155274 RepID=UPI00341B5F1C
MTSELTPAEVHRRIVETAFTEEGLKYVDPDVVDHRGGAGGDHVGIAAWREKWAAISRGEFLADFRDLAVRVEQNVSEGEFSVNRYTSTGTQVSTGRSYAVTSMDMVRVRDGRIVEHWALMDVTDRAAQLRAGG